MRGRSAFLVLLLLGGPARATAPTWHGTLVLRPAAGAFNRRTGEATLRASAWHLKLADGSPGIDPATQQVMVSIGSNNLRVPLGDVRVRRHGTVFVYRRPPTPTPGVVFLRMRRVTPVRWEVAFRLRGLDLSALVLESEACVPMAIIVGDNDGFSGVRLVRPGGARAFRSRTVALTNDCAISNDWPWLQ